MEIRENFIRLSIRPCCRGNMKSVAYGSYEECWSDCFNKIIREDLVDFSDENHKSFKASLMEFSVFFLDGLIDA